MASVVHHRLHRRLPGSSRRLRPSKLLPLRSQEGWGKVRFILNDANWELGALAIFNLADLTGLFVQQTEIMRRELEHIVNTHLEALSSTAADLNPTLVGRLLNAAKVVHHGRLYLGWVASSPQRPPCTTTFI